MSECIIAKPFTALRNLRDRVKALEANAGSGGGSTETTNCNYPYMEDGDFPGCFYRMEGDVKEWVNPPMIVGVSYRTTERWQGKPVHTILFSLGTLPNNTEKTVTIGIGENTPIAMSTSFTSNTGWRVTNFPSVIVIPNGLGNCIVKTTDNLTQYTECYCTLKYVV